VCCSPAVRQGQATARAFRFTPVSGQSRDDTGTNAQPIELEVFYRFVPFFSISLCVLRRCARAKRPPAWPLSRTHTSPAPAPAWVAYGSNDVKTRGRTCSYARNGTRPHIRHRPRPQLSMKQPPVTDSSDAGPSDRYGGWRRCVSGGGGVAQHACMCIQLECRRCGATVAVLVLQGWLQLRCSLSPR
jgi:hypothetical protein